VGRERLKRRLQEKRLTTPAKTRLLLCSIQPSIQALSPDLSDCRNRGLRDIGLLNTRWYLSRNEEAGIVIDDRCGRKDRSFGFEGKFIENAKE
jgi:hypothetical protein